MSGFVLDGAAPETKLQELAQLQSELRKLMDTTKNEKKRREKEVASLEELLQRQRESLATLKSSRTRVVVFREFKTLRLAVNLNIKNLAYAREALRMATSILTEHESRLSDVTKARDSLAKQLAGQGQVLQFPTREVRHGRRARQN